MCSFRNQTTIVKYEDFVRVQYGADALRHHERSAPLHQRGKRILDAAAMRIVKLAAPYAPLPANITKDTDILTITRTWTFTQSDRLESE